jgi:hypothetical protein
VDGGVSEVADSSPCLRLRREPVLEQRHNPEFGCAQRPRHRRLGEGLIPVLRAQPGFRAYYAFVSEYGHPVSVSVCDSREAAARSNEQAGAWVAANMRDLAQVSRSLRLPGWVARAPCPPAAPGDGQQPRAADTRFVPGTADLFREPRASYPLP